MTTAKTLAAQLRERNRAYGKASAEIGRLRDREARLLLERAQDRAASPGSVNGDVLAEVLRAAAPDRWTQEARAEFAEQVLRDMLPSGFRIYRGPNREPWPAPTPAAAEAPVSPGEASLPPFPFVEGVKIGWYQGNGSVMRTITSVWPNPESKYGADVFVDENRVTQMGPINVDEWRLVGLPDAGGDAVGAAEAQEQIAEWAKAQTGGGA
jgi:hypothetical protein